MQNKTVESETSKQAKQPSLQSKNRVREKFHSKSLKLFRYFVPGAHVPKQLDSTKLWKWDGFLFPAKSFVSRILNGKEINSHCDVKSQWKQTKIMTQLERKNEAFPLLCRRRVVSLWSLYSYFVIGTQRLQQDNFRFHFFFGILDKVQVFFLLLNFFVGGEFFFHLLCSFLLIKRKQKNSISYRFCFLLICLYFVVPDGNGLESRLPALTGVVEILIKCNYKWQSLFCWLFFTSAACTVMLIRLTLCQYFGFISNASSNGNDPSRNAFGNESKLRLYIGMGTCNRSHIISFRV